MGVETWDAGPVNIWEPTTHRKVYLVGWNQEVRSSNKAVTFLDIWDGAGNDDISVGAVNTTIWQNSGNDRYFIKSGINATIHSGVGFKKISTNFLLGKIQVIEEAAWNHPVANTNRHIDVKANHAHIDSGFGDDTIEVWGTFGAKVADRGGNNTIKVRGIAKVEVYSGEGNDYIVVGGFYAVVADSGGDNVVDATGLAAEVYTGWGNDKIWVGGAYAKVESGVGNDMISIDGIYTRVNNWMFGGNKHVIARAAFADIWTGSGNDIIEIWGVGAHVETGWGDDTIHIGAVGAKINAGEGNNTINFNGVGAEVWVGDGNDTININAAGIKIDTHGGNDVVNIGAFVADVYTGDGDDRVYSLSVGGQKIDLANGNDYLEAYGGVNVIYGGYWGDKDITVGGGLNVVQVGHGNSTVRAYGGANVVLTGQGNNTVTADGGANVLLNGNGRYNANELCVCRHAKPQTPSRWSTRLPSQKQICANHPNTSRQDGTNIGHISADTSACASSMKALMDAIHLIQLHGFERVAVIAVEDQISLGVLEFFGDMHICLSREQLAQGAKPSAFDDTHHGFLMGQGAALIWLETQTALERRDQCTALPQLRSAVTCGEWCDSPLGQDPQGSGYVRAMQWALQSAGLAAKDIDVIKTHGTGTPLNNSSEAHAIAQVMQHHDFVATSYKPRIGHTLGASGLIESVLAIQDANQHKVRGIANRTAHDARFLSHDVYMPVNNILALSAGMGNVYGAAVWSMSST